VVAARVVETGPNPTFELALTKAEKAPVEDVRSARLTLEAPAESSLKLGDVAVVRVIQRMGEQALVDVGGNLSWIRFPAGLSPEFAFNARIVAVHPRILYQIDSSAASQKAGETIEGVVTRSTGSNRFEITSESGRFDAIGNAEAPVGSRLLLRVEKQSDLIAARIIDYSPPLKEVAGAILRDNLAALPPREQVFKDLLLMVREANIASPGDSTLKRLSDFLESAVGQPPDTQGVRRLLREGGLAFESRLSEWVKDGKSSPDVLRGDLKGMLLELVSARSDTGHGISSELRATAEQYLRHIESQQALNLLSSSSGQGWHFEIPFAFGDNLTSVQVEVRPDPDARGGGSRGKGSGSKLLFLLELGGFGKTRIDAHVEGTGIQARFQVEEGPAAEFINSRLPMLRGVLEEMGFGTIALESKSVAGEGMKEIEEPDPVMDLIDRTIVEKLVNLKA